MNFVKELFKAICKSIAETCVDFADTFFIRWWKIQIAPRAGSDPRIERKESKQMLKNLMKIIMENFTEACRTYYAISERL